MNELSQRSIPARTDLREMMRQHIVRRGLECMEDAGRRRDLALAEGTVAEYRQTVRSIVRGFYGALPAGKDAGAPETTQVSVFEHDGFRLENVLFDSYPGWQVNATVYVPTDFQPPYPGVVVPVGHSGKQFESYQLPCQYFARGGYVAVCFDPPGQAGEKQPGNDHFNDGVRDYLLGENSSRYFVADALRCIDYLTTRDDVDTGIGVAMTGVSGGGTTTTFAAQLDDRIRVIGPSCCVAPLADLDIARCYAGCPETHQIGRYARGVDEVDLLCAAAPAPCLLMAAERDEVFHIGHTRFLADAVGAFYERAGAAEKFRFFVDAGGHAYSLAQAREFTRFMNRWLRCEPDRPVPDPADAACRMLPHEELRCRPRLDVNMRTRAVGEAEELSEDRDGSPEAIRNAAADIAGVNGAVPAPDAEVGEPFQVWTHDWRPVMLRREKDIELPATLLTARDEGPTATLLHFNQEGRHRLLYQNGLMCRAIRFLDRDRPSFNLLAVDLRGWGDSAPGMYPYEMAGWGGIERYLAYATAALGDPVLSMRIRDALGALAWVRTRPEVDPERIILTASALGCIVALHVAGIDNAVGGVVGWEGLSSFRSLLAAPHYSWPADAFLPGVLRHYDLPQLAAAVDSPVRLHGLRNGAGQAAEGTELTPWQGPANVRAVPGAQPEAILRSIGELVG